MKTLKMDSFYLANLTDICLNLYVQITRQLPEPRADLFVTHLEVISKNGSCLLELFDNYRPLDGQGVIPVDVQLLTSIFNSFTGLYDYLCSTGPRPDQLDLLYVDFNEALAVIFFHIDEGRDYLELT